MEHIIFICTKCGEELPLTKEYFYVRSKDPLVFRKDCKRCVKVRCNKYRKENYEEIIKRKRTYYENNADKLRQKAREYNALPHVKERVKEYHRSRKNDPAVIESHRLSNKRYLQKLEVKKKIAKRRFERYHDNIDEERRKAREYVRKDHIKAKKRERYKNSDTTKIRLRCSIRSSIIYHLKKRGKSKNGSLTKYLGYSLDELMAHIESLWEPWMNWDNWGPYIVDLWDDNDSSTWTWHLDHIKRHREFDYESMDDSQFRECWALSNLRPLSAKVNIIRQ